MRNLVSAPLTLMMALTSAVSLSSCNNSDEAPTVHPGAPSEQPLLAPCEQAKADAVALQNEIRACETDADCAFVDATGQVLPAGSQSFVPTDDCTHIPTFGTVNPVRLKASAETWNAAKASIDEKCGAELRSECTDMKGFLPGQSVPTCVTGRCALPPIE